MVLKHYSALTNFMELLFTNIFVTVCSAQSCPGIFGHNNQQRTQGFGMERSPDPFYSAVLTLGDGIFFHDKL